MRDKNRLQSMTKIDKNSGVKPADGKTMFDEPTLFIDLIEAQSRMTDNFRNKCLESNIKWLLGFENYVNDKDRSIKIRTHYRNYAKGAIVFVDFFGNFGKEYTYDHPAIVLKDNGGLLIVAPMTSNHQIFQDSKKYHIKLPSGDSKLGNRRTNSTILLEQVRTISKNRVIKKQVLGRVSDNEKLKEIDLALIEYLAAYTFNNINSDFNNQISSKDEQIRDKDAIIKQKDQLIEELEKKILELEK